MKGSLKFTPALKSDAIDKEPPKEKVKVDVVVAIHL